MMWSTLIEEDGKGYSPGVFHLKAKSSVLVDVSPKIEVKYLCGFL